MIEVEQYVIREKDSGLFLYDRRQSFGDLTAAVLNGVCFNQRATAEKRLAELNRGFSGESGLVYTLYDLNDEHYTTIEQYALSETSHGHYVVKFRPIQLEVAVVVTTLSPKR